MTSDPLPVVVDPATVEPPLDELARVEVLPAPELELDVDVSVPEVLEELSEPSAVVEPSPLEDEPSGESELHATSAAVRR